MVAEHSTSSLNELREIDLLNAQAYALRDEDADLARAKNETVYKLLENAPDYHKGMVEALTIEAFAEIRAANYTKSLELSLRAEKLCNEHSIIFLLPRVYNIVGMSYAGLSVFGLGTQYFFKQLFLAQELNDLSQIAGATHDLAFYYLMCGSTHKSIAMFEEAKDLFSQLEDEWPVVLANRNLVECYLQLNDIEKAEALIEKCLAFANENSHTAAERFVYDSFAKLHEQKGEFQKALDYIAKGQKNVKSMFGDASHLSFKARILLQLKEYQEAEILLNSGIISDDLSLIDLTNCYKLLAQSYTEQGEFEKSHQALLSYVACNERLSQTIKQKSIETSSEVQDLEKLRIEAREAKQNNLALRQTVKELNVLQQKYYQQSIYDSLTKIPNRRYITEFLSTNFASAKRYNYSLGVALMDLDYFKSINDNFSHQVGDDVLKQVAQILQSHVRESDAIARFGGEEFLLVFKETSIDDNIIFCERLRLAIEAYDWETIADGLKITASFGIASLATVAECKHYEDLISFADKKLYESKDKGRNCISS